jgi:hypothetical protein
LGMEPSKWNYYSKQTCVEAALVWLTQEML